MKIDLKPCPFCGGEAIISRGAPEGEDRLNGIIGYWHVECSQCYAHTADFPEQAEYDEPVDAFTDISAAWQESANLWNKRAGEGCGKDYCEL